MAKVLEKVCIFAQTLEQSNMKKLLLLPLICLFLACGSSDQNILDGTWGWVADNREIHIHTFDNYVGFAIVHNHSMVSATEYGKMKFTSDSTATMNFIGGGESKLTFSHVDKETIGIRLDNEVGFWMRKADANAYKEDEKEKSFISVMFAEIEADGKK